MEAGDKVRIKTDPARTGVLSGKEFKIGTRVKLGVHFQDSHEYILESQLELVPEGETLDELIGTGQYSGREVLRNSITYRRLSGRLANVIYSMESTDTDFYPYQFKPVLNLLDSPSRGLLIADEVGLGKTIESGLIWTELRSRLDVSRLLVICPALLREKWVRELRNRFDVQAQKADAQELLSVLGQYEKDEISGFALVCSKDGLRPPRDYEDGHESDTPRGRLAQLLSDREADDPLFDLVIVDEAHYMRNQESMTSKLGRLIRPTTDYMVLLSATPIQLESQDLFQLLRIIDDQTYAHVDFFHEILSANAPINALHNAIQRGEMTSDEYLALIDRALAHPLLASNRQLKHLKSMNLDDQKLGDAQLRAQVSSDLEKINLLSKAVSRTRKREVTEMRVVRKPVPEYIEMHAVEEAFYNNVTEAVREYCEGKDISEGFLLTMPQRQVSSCMPAALKAWNEKLGAEEADEQVYDDFGSEAQSNREELGPLTAHLVAQASNLGSYELLKEHDTKYKRLEEILKKFFRDYPDEKLIVFTYFRQTIHYLSERLEEAGIRSKVLMGGMKENKDEAIEDFYNDASIKVLVSSEVASEGVDLQFCRMLINYDLPWNPMKVEQRIGRIDRIGQKAEKIMIWNMLFENTVDSRIYQRLHNRLHIFERALGGLEAVIGDKITKLGYELLSGRLTPEEEEARIRQTEQAIANLQRESDDLEDQASSLVAYSDYIINEVRAAKFLQRYISGDDLARYFIDYFEASYPGCAIRQLYPDALEFDIALSADATSDLRDFLRKKRFERWTNLQAGGSGTKFVFENKNKKAKRGVEIISQFHPVIQFINSKLGESERLIPTATCVPKMAVANVPEGVYGFYVKCWKVTGVRDNERLAYAAVNCSTREFLSEDQVEQLVNVASRVGKYWASARNIIDIDKIRSIYDQCDSMLEKEYNQYIARIERENEDRADLLANTAKKHFEGQIARIRKVIESAKQKGNERMIPANEGKIRKHEQRLGERLMEIENGRKIRYSDGDVALGVIEVR